MDFRRLGSRSVGNTPDRPITRFGTGFSEQNVRWRAVQEPYGWRVKGPPVTFPDFIDPTANSP
jgi:hypothetical protein